ncbi:MAG: hydroxyisourate hydrolase [Elusimicrobia bacterium]|nr:hydroxyisourate hydrolase [Elusimicrobiota bacterium]
MSPITTHVLDTARGLPAMGVPVKLEARKAPDRWELIGRGTTDTDGRASELLPDKFPVENGVYRLIFETGVYFKTVGVKDPFYPNVTVVFEVRDQRHHHVPLLLSPFGYSTYRGS